MDPKIRNNIEAAVFRRLVAHLRDNPEVQNIDLMNLSGFCRNCLGKWYKTAAEEEGIEMDDMEARDTIYGMPYAKWKAQHQKPADEKTMQEFSMKTRE